MSASYGCFDPQLTLGPGATQHSHESSASAGVYGLAALLHDQFFAYSIDMSTAAEEVRGGLTALLDKLGAPLCVKRAVCEE